MNTPGDMLRNGDVRGAIAAAETRVRSAPSDLQHRWLLSELLVVAGDHDRADGQLDAIIELEPQAAVSAVPLRQLLRAEAARRQFFDEGRVPEFLDGVAQSSEARLRAFVLLRSGDASAAAVASAGAETARSMLPGKLGGPDQPDREFLDFRDLDDVTADVFEVLTHTGKYYWISMRSVVSVEFSPPARPLDLIWRKAHMVVRDAFDAEVHLPAVYGTLDGADDATRLGRRTDWLGDEAGYVRGVGRRTFVLDGEQALDMLEIHRLTFAQA